MTVYLVTTTDHKGPRSADLARYLRSLESQNTPSGFIVAYLLLQNCLPDECEDFKAQTPAYFRVSSTPGRLSISKARNQILHDLKAACVLDQNDVIGFPDDDCWLPERFIPGLSAVFKQLPALGLFVCRVSLNPDTEDFDHSDVRTARTAEIVRFASSNCMFIRGSILKVVGYFDPNLGLGTPMQGGEDTDFAVRAFLSSTLAVFSNRELIGHRKPDRASAAKYYPGSLLVLACYAKQTSPLMWEFCRKIMVGLCFVLAKRLTLNAYKEALKAGFRAFKTLPSEENRVS